MDTIEMVARAIATILETNDRNWEAYARTAKEAIEAMAGDGVLVRLDRIEGYEDVHPDILTEDAVHWPSSQILWPTEWPTEEDK